MIAATPPVDRTQGAGGEHGITHIGAGLGRPASGQIGPDGPPACRRAYHGLNDSLEDTLFGLHLLDEGLSNYVRLAGAKLPQDECA